MTRQELIEQIRLKESFLCVGLDTDLSKIPAHLLETEDPIFEFNKAIIDATKDFAVAYKPNIAFYECYGPKGWESLQKTIDYIPKNIFTIADAKRGDIGNTSTYYAKTFFDYFDFQMTQDSKGEELFKKVLRKSSEWGTADNLMFVVGATRAEGIGEVRRLVPNHFFLVPGVGAQGGSLEDVAEYGWNEDCGLLVNSSRGIIYASQGTDFANAARIEAEKLQKEMSIILKNKGFIR